MRFKFRRFSSYVLLATCTSISTLGEGLHLLTPHAGHHHHHHHGRSLFTYATHGSKHGDHHLEADDHAGYFAEGAARESKPAVVLVTFRDHNSDSHLCGICRFLFQSISQPADVVEPSDWQPLVAATPNVLQLICTPGSLGPQAPRGPPHLA